MCGKQYEGETTDEFRPRSNNYKSNDRKKMHGMKHIYKNIYFSILKINHNTYSWLPNRRPTLLINFSNFSAQDILIPTPRLLIIGESFKPKQTFSKQYTYAAFFEISINERPVCITFCFASSCKEASTFCFVL